MTGQGAYRIEALVLRKTKLKESDLIVTLLAEDGSLVRAVAHGARKPQSPFASRLEPCAVVDVLLARGRSLDVAKEARFVAPNAAVRADFDVSAAALPLVELAGKVAEVGLENPRLFQCAVAALALMDKAAAGTIGAENAVVVGCADRARILCAACLLKELAFAGFRPSLAHCAVCGEPLSFAAPSSAFSPHEGGCLCDACAAAGERFRRIDAAVCVLARDLLHRPFADVVALSAPSSHVKGVLRIVQDLVEEHVGSRLKSVSFLLGAWE